MRVETSNDANHRRLCTTLLIDGQPVGGEHVVDWRELFRSLKGPGEFFVWTSPSGEPLEAGIEDCLVTTRDQGTISWEWMEPVSLRGLTQDDDRDLQTATFAAKDYEAAIWQGWWAACSLIRRDPDLIVHPSSLGATGLLSLDRWFKTPDAKPFEPSYLPFPSFR